MIRPERRRAIIYLGLIFVCGFLAGAVATNLWVHLGPRGESVRADASRTAKATPRSTQRAVNWFTEQLSLTPEQAKQLHQILDETKVAYREHELQLKTIRREGNNRIRAILDDEQKVRFDQILARRESKRKEHF